MAFNIVILVIYTLCLFPTIVVYPVIKQLPPNIPNIFKFFMAWFIMPPFLMWWLYQKFTNNSK